MASAQKRVREDPEVDLDLPTEENNKKVRYEESELFELLDESDSDLEGQDLEWVMKSFEDEIETSASGGSSPSPALVVSQPELGYLLEASDDELGLPPPSAADGEVAGLNLGENWGFEEEEAAVFGAAEFGFVDGGDDGGSDGGDYLALDGLFDYSGVGFGSAEFLWRSESMPAQ